MEHLEKLRLVNSPDGVLLSVKAVPGASRSRVAGVLGEALKVAVAAAAEKGKANAAVAALLAEVLGVGARNVRLVSGPTSPRKEFLIVGLSADQLRRKLAEL